MTLTETHRIDPTEMYAHMGTTALMAHIRAAVGHLVTRGVTMTDRAELGLDELEEAVIEHEARTDSAALDRRLAACRAACG